MKRTFQLVFASEHWKNSAEFLETGFIKSTFSDFCLFYHAVSSSDYMTSIQENANSEILRSSWKQKQGTWLDNNRTSFRSIHKVYMLVNSSFNFPVHVGKFSLRRNK